MPTNDPMRARNRATTKPAGAPARPALFALSLALVACSSSTNRTRQPIDESAQPSIVVRNQQQRPSLDSATRPPRQANLHLTGIVTGDSGEMLPGALVTCRELDLIFEYVGRTDAQGAFSIEVIANCAYEMTATADGYYEFPWRESARFVVSPDAQSTRIALTKERPTTFRVVDANTGAPVEFFATAIGEMPVDTQQHGRVLRVSRDSDEPASAHPGGEVTRIAEPGLHAVRVAAPGYSPATVPVEFSEEHARVQCIALQPGSRLVGTVASSPRMGAKIAVVCAKDDANLGASEELALYVGRLPETDFEQIFPCPTRRVRLVDGGAFSFVDLPVGLYAIGVLRDGILVASRRSLVLQRGATLTLDPITLE